MFFLKNATIRSSCTIRGLRLWYNSIFCNKRFKVFLECQMFRDKPIPLLQIKMWNFYAILMRRSVIVFTYSHLFLCRIYCSTMYRYIKSSVTVFKRKRCEWYLTKCFLCLSVLSTRQVCPIHSCLGVLSIHPI